MMFVDVMLGSSRYLIFFPSFSLLWMPILMRKELMKVKLQYGFSDGIQKKKGKKKTIKGIMR